MSGVNRFLRFRLLLYQRLRWGDLVLPQCKLLSTSYMLSPLVDQHLQGMSLVNCAAAYSLTNSLISETPTASPSSVAAASSTPASVVSVPTTSASLPGTTSTTTLPLSSAPLSVAPTTTASNATVVTFTPSASQSSVFKGAANELAAYRGLPALVLALGFLGVVAVL